MSRFFEQVFGIYFDDLDPFQILHNARYLLLFERTLGEFWEEIGVVRGVDARPGSLVARNEIDYLRPVKGLGKIRVRIAIERMGTKSMTVAFRVLPMDSDDDYAKGRRVLVYVDQTTLQAAPWPDDFRTVLAPWLPSG